MKSEPEQFGIADLARVKIEPWTGVRSYFARAHMRAMTVGDAVLFHHSNATPPGVAGTARVVRVQVVDETQFDPASKYYDPKATRDAPIWDCVEVEYVSTLPHYVSLDRIRAEPSLTDMTLLRRGMRLSVQPVNQAEYEAIVALGQIAPPPAPPKPARTPKAVGGKPKAVARKPKPVARMPKAVARTPKAATRTPKAAARTPKAKPNAAKPERKSPKPRR